MQKWEYETIMLLGMTLSKYEEASNSLGSDGWELVSVDNGVAYFKRPARSISKGELPGDYPKGTYYDNEGHIALVID